MHELFRNALIGSQDFEGYYTPERWAGLEQIFARACTMADIAAESKHQRDEMALLILLASEIYDDEDLLVQAAFRVISKAH
jgi:hypothetical protein